jgi:predicted transcriptional regulator
MTEGSDWSTYINHFELFDNAYIAITEPLNIHTRHKLYNKQVQLGSKTDLKVSTEFTLQNQNIDESIRNTFKQTSIQNARVVIRKNNDDINLPSRVLITSSTDVSITADNTIIYSLDTTNITAVSPFVNSDIGNHRGTYSLQVEYTLFSEKIVSPLMYFIVK